MKAAAMQYEEGHGRLDFDAIENGLASVVPEILENILPGGRMIGREYVCSDLTGGPGDSCRFNVENLKFADFATGDKGHGIVSLYSKVKGISNPEAARILAAEYGIDQARPTQKDASRLTPIVPIPEDAPPPPEAHPVLGVPALRTRYLDCFVYRFEPEGKPKEIRPLTLCKDEGGNLQWVWKAAPEPRALLNADKLKDNPDAAVLVVEGEKTAMAAQRMAGNGLIVTTCSGGSGAVSKADWTPLMGRRVCIWPDNDKAGFKAAIDIAARLDGEVTIIVPPEDWTKGQDLADVQWDRAQLFAEIKKRKETPSNFAEAARQRFGIGLAPTADGGLEMIRLGTLMEMPDEAPLWVVDGLFPEGGLVGVNGPPKGGKSTALRHGMLCVARGLPWLCRRTMKGACVYLALEEKLSEVRRHFKGLGATGDDDIYIYAATAPQDALKKLRTVVDKIRPVLVVIDPLFRLVRVKDSSAYAEVTGALEPLLALGRETGACVAFVHHTRKNSRGNGAEAILGSTAIHGAVDCSLMIERTGTQRIIFSEQRYGQDMDPQILLMDETGAVSLGGTKAEFERNKIEAAVLTVLQESSLTEPELAKAVECRTQALRAILRHMTTTGTVIRTGKGTKGNPFFYNLPDTGTREQEFQNPDSRFLFPKIPPLWGGTRNENPQTPTSSGQMLVPGISEKPEKREQESLFPEQESSREQESATTNLTVLEV